MSGAENTGGNILEHLDALRSVLLRIVIVVGICAAGAFVLMPQIFDSIIMWPCRADFPFYRLLYTLQSVWTSNPEPDTFSLHPTSLELTSQFFIHVSASCWTAVVVSFPIIIYLLWGFISPGLYDHEKRGVTRAFLLGNIMFFAGAAVGYFVVFPLTLRFMATYSLSPEIGTIVSLDSYMDNFFGLILVMGAVFELPLVAWLLGCMGILKRSFFARYRRHAVLALLIVAALITPTGDPLSLLAVFLPIYVLWEASARLVPSTKTEKT